MGGFNELSTAGKIQLLISLPQNLIEFWLCLTVMNKSDMAYFQSSNDKCITIIWKQLQV